MNDEPIIEVRGLTKHFGTTTAVDNLDLTVRRGDIYGFLGPNGAGKSTTIRMMLSLIRPTAGEIRIFGLSLAENRSDVLRRVGAIVEKPDCYLYLTARRNLDILGRLAGADVSRRTIDATLDRVGLLERADDKVKTYSYGMKQRLGIAQALLHNPDLIILDEPVNGLDPQGVREIRSLILELAQENRKTVFLSSHILAEVEMTANRMAIIANGHTVVEGGVKELLDEGTLQVSIETNNSEHARKVLANAGFTPVDNVNGKNSVIVFSMRKNDIPTAIARLAEADISIYDIGSTRSLEEYFISITGSSPQKQ
ncbi:ATP-binding cassette domain-containing protein [Ignavibacteria bacterium]|nr:ABC transporter ATP-binding protein [Bacteroidota bacterium]MCZ2132217.1 ABC transporter ATP-binding protein [Bacteroidota bacterium]